MLVCIANEMVVEFSFFFFFFFIFLKIILTNPVPNVHKSKQITTIDDINTATIMLPLIIENIN